MKAGAEFFNLYNHGFIRAAVGVPEVHVADPAFNATRTIELMTQAAHHKAILVLFPELGLSAYSCEDLFHQQALLEASIEALHTVLQASAAASAPAASAIAAAGRRALTGARTPRCSQGARRRGRTAGSRPRPGRS